MPSLSTQGGFGSPARAAGGGATGRTLLLSGGEQALAASRTRRTRVVRCTSEVDRAARLRNPLAKRKSGRPDVSPARRYRQALLRERAQRAARLRWARRLSATPPVPAGAPPLLRPPPPGSR